MGCHLLDRNALVVLRTGLREPETDEGRSLRAHGALLRAVDLARTKTGRDRLIEPRDHWLLAVAHEVRVAEGNTDTP